MKNLANENEEFDKKLQELEKMVDDLCDSDGNSRVIAVNGKIQELLEKAYKIGWNHATENCCGCLDFL